MSRSELGRSSPVLHEPYGVTSYPGPSLSSVVLSTTPLMASRSISLPLLLSARAASLFTMNLPTSLFKILPSLPQSAALARAPRPPMTLGVSNELVSDMELGKYPRATSPSAVLVSEGVASEIQSKDSVAREMGTEGVTRCAAAVEGGRAAAAALAFLPFFFFFFLLQVNPTRDSRR